MEVCSIFILISINNSCSVSSQQFHFITNLFIFWHLQVKVWWTGLWDVDWSVERDEQWAVMVILQIHSYQRLSIYLMEPLKWPAIIKHECKSNFLTRQRSQNGSSWKDECSRIKLTVGRPHWHIARHSLSLSNIHHIPFPSLLPASIVINTLVDKRKSNRLPEGTCEASQSPCCLYLGRIN